jgi:hypothetical protein
MTSVIEHLSTKHEDLNSNPREGERERSQLAHPNSHTQLMSEPASTRLSKPVLDRKSMRVNALYSCPYLNQQKPLVLPVIAYTLSSTKLEIRTK